jgi:hypothetical protein
MSQHGLKNEHFASFFRVIWSVVGHAKGWRDQSAREKSKPLPNLKVGLPQLLRVSSVRVQYFEGVNLVLLITNALEWFVGDPTRVVGYVKRFAQFGVRLRFP